MMPAETTPVFATRGPQHHYFGYYDKSPLDRTASRLLCLRVDFAERLPTRSDVAEIGFWTLADGQYHRLDETRAFNWQQGCMLQWIGPDFNRYIIFNDRRDERFVSVILDTATGRSEVIPFPVYSVHPRGASALGVDFERHYFPRRGYAYDGIVKPEKNRYLVEGDGIFHVDLKSKTVDLIISTKQMYLTNHLTSMDDGSNYLEHLMFNCSGSRFLFMHRWVLGDGGIYTRVYSAGPRGEDMRCLLDSGKATHYCWRGDDHVLLWGAPRTVASGLRRHQQLVRFVVKPLLPIYHGLVNNRSRLARRVTGASFLLFEDEDRPEISRFATDAFTVDGHPSWNPVHDDWMVADTYNDEESYQWLYLYDCRRRMRIDIGKFASPAEVIDSPLRCDLHPRWDHGGRFICVDSLHQGSRQMYLFDVADLLGQP